MRNNTLEAATITLDPRDSEAARVVTGKIDRARKDIRRLEEIALEADREAEAARLELGRVELALAMNEKPPAPKPDAIRKVEDALSKADAARDERARREQVVDDLESEYRDVLRAESAKIAEAVAPQIRELTQTYLDGAQRAFQAEQELSRIYESLSSTRHSLYNRYRIHGPIPPHDNLAMTFHTDPRFGNYVQAVERVIIEARKLGYDI